MKSNPLEMGKQVVEEGRDKVAFNSNCNGADFLENSVIGSGILGNVEGVDQVDVLLNSNEVREAIE